LSDEPCLSFFIRLFFFFGFACFDVPDVLFHARSRVRDRLAQRDFLLRCTDIPVDIGDCLVYLAFSCDSRSGATPACSSVLHRSHVPR
jgi:hypothetical protein